MIDRGVIKWQPFNSCFNSDIIIKNINKEKNWIKYPNLSEDQLNEIEKIINKAYELKTIIHICYYYNGKIFNKEGKINYLDTQYKKLSLDNATINFSQIINVFEI